MSFTQKITISILFFIQFQVYAQDKYNFYSDRELDSLAKVSYSRGEFKKSILLQRENEKRLKKNGILLDSLKYAQIGINIGISYWQVGDYKMAAKVTLDVLDLYEQLGEDSSLEYFTALNSLAVFYQEGGEYEKAEPIYLKIKDYLEKEYGKTHSAFSGVLNNLATLYQDMGYFERAEPLLIQAQKIKEQIMLSKKGDTEKVNGYVRMSNNLAYLYKDMQKYEKAKELFWETQKLTQKSDDKLSKRYLAVSINNLAELYQKEKQYKKAEESYKQALEIRKAELGVQHPKYALSLRKLGGLYFEKKEYAKAKELFIEAQNIRLNVFGGEHPLYAESFNDLGELAFEQKKYLEAVPYVLNAIVANCKKIDTLSTIEDLLDTKGLSTVVCYSTQHFIESLAILLNILKKQESNDVAYFSLAKIAMSVNENFRVKLSGDKDKLRALENNTIFIQHGIESAMKLEKEVHLKEAFSFAELNKSVLLTDAIRGTRARTFGDLPEDLITEEIDLQKKLVKLKKEQLEARTKTLKDSINLEVANLQLEMNKFYKSLQNKYPKYHAIKYGDISTDATAIQKMLQELRVGDNLLLEFFQTKDQLYLFALNKDKIKVFELGITKEIMHLQVEKLRKALTSYRFINSNPNKAYSLYTETAHWFYKNIMEEALQNFSQKKLIIVTDGELGYLPFETFLMEKSKDQGLGYKELPYLMNDYTINYNYSSTLWKENSSTLNQNNNNSILACAGDYDNLDTTFLKKRLPEVARIRKGLKPLAAAQKEVKVLSDFFYGDFLYKEDVNESFLKKMHLIMV